MLKTKMKEYLQKLDTKQRLALGVGAVITLTARAIYAVGPEKAGNFVLDTLKDPCLQKTTSELVQECKTKREKYQIPAVPIIDW